MTEIYFYLCLKIDLYWVQLSGLKIWNCLWSHLKNNKYGLYIVLTALIWVCKLVVSTDNTIEKYTHKYPHNGNMPHT